MNQSEKILEIKDLCVEFQTVEGTVKAINHLNYTLHKGEKLGIVGESGSGKSVSSLGIMQLIPNPPGKIVAGEILYKGQDLVKTSEKDMQKIRGNEISMIFQEPMTSLNPIIKCGKQIAESLRLHRGMNKKEAMEEAMNLVCASDLFRDVAENTWYHEGVDYMVRQGYMDGMGGGLFGVNGTMTRGQMVTILYRIAGKPSVEGLENPFRDVAEGRYYTDAVIWAAANGIVEGMEEGVFAPEGAVTRQQVAVILYRHSGAEAGNEDLLSSYPDGKQVAPYARQAMNWAVSQGLIRGVENGGVTTLSPAATATRAQMATIFLRYLEQQG